MRPHALLRDREDEPGAARVGTTGIVDANEGVQDAGANGGMRLRGCWRLMGGVCAATKGHVARTKHAARRPGCQTRGRRLLRSPP